MTDDKAKPVLPEHMDRWSRNARLYETLKGMGVFVTPIPEPGDPTKIREMIVAADLPVEQAPQDSAQTGVHAVVKRPKIREVVRSSEGDGDNVVYFPPKL